jgi:hypothetical protein
MPQCQFIIARPWGSEETEFGVVQTAVILNRERKKNWLCWVSVNYETRLEALGLCQRYTHTYQIIVVMPNWRFSRAKSKSRSRLIAARPRTGPDSLTFLPGQDDSARFPTGFGVPIDGTAWCSSTKCRVPCVIARSYRSILSDKPKFDNIGIISSGIIQLILNKESILEKGRYMT